MTTMMVKCGGGVGRRRSLQSQWARPATLWESLVAWGPEVSLRGQRLSLGWGQRLETECAVVVVVGDWGVWPDEVGVAKMEVVPEIQAEAVMGVASCRVVQLEPHPHSVWDHLTLMRDVDYHPCVSDLCYHLPVSIPFCSVSYPHYQLPVLIPFCSVSGPFSQEEGARRSHAGVVALQCCQTEVGQTDRGLTAAKHHHRLPVAHEGVGVGDQKNHHGAAAGDQTGLKPPSTQAPRPRTTECWWDPASGEREGSVVDPSSPVKMKMMRIVVVGGDIEGAGVGLAGAVPSQPVSHH